MRKLGFFLPLEFYYSNFLLFIVTIGQINAGDAHAHHIGLYIAAMLILGLTAEALLHLDGRIPAREDQHEQRNEREKRYEA